MPTIVECPNCARQHEVTTALQGRKSKCPCGFMFRMPGDKIATDPGLPSQHAMSAMASLQGPRPDLSLATVNAHCPNCLKSFEIKAELSGKNVRCHCGNVFAVPTNGEDAVLAELDLSAQPLAAPVISQPAAAQLVDPFGKNGIDPFAGASPTNQYWKQQSPQVQYTKLRKAETRIVEPSNFGSIIVRIVGGIALLAGLVSAGFIIWYVSSADNGASGRGVVKALGLSALGIGSGAYWLTTGSWGPQSEGE